MNEQTQKLMTALLSAPDLVQSLRKDPVGTLSKVASSDAAAPLFAAVKNAVANFGPLKDCEPQSRLPGIADLVRSNVSDGAASRSGDIPIVSIVSLGVVMASVAVLGTVCAVAVVREGTSGDH